MVWKSILSQYKLVCKAILLQKFQIWLKFVCVFELPLKYKPKQQYLVEPISCNKLILDYTVA